MENYRKWKERQAVHKRFGYDGDAAARFVLDAALPLKGRTLEIGTGTGRFMSVLAEHVPLLTTVDINFEEQLCARLLATHQGQLRKIRFLVQDAMCLTWHDHVFDAVVSMNALHHIQDPCRAVEEALRVCKPTGKIVLSDFNARGFQVMDCVHREEGRLHTRVPYRFEDLVARLTMAGWETVWISGECQNVLIAQRPRKKTRSGSGR